MLSGYAKREWATMLVIGVMLAATLAYIQVWWAVVLVIIATAALLAFFRDPERRIPSQRGVMVSPADGRISSVHHVDNFEPFGEGATCIRVFLSVLDVHVNRSPCHGIVHSITYKPGAHLNALNPESAEDNESTMMVMMHPTREQPVAAVRQVAGLLARTIVCGAREGQVLQRGQRFGVIKLGSTTELYIPDRVNPTVLVREGQRVQGGITVLADVQPQTSGAPRSDEALQKKWSRSTQAAQEIIERVEEKKAAEEDAAWRAETQEDARRSPAQVPGANATTSHAPDDDR